MFPLALGLFLLVPLIEVVLFIEIGGGIGTGWTVIACLATAAAGALLVRGQGRSTMASARRAVGEGRVPAREAFDGVCLLLAGALLLTPGFLTDTLGFLFLIRPLRDVLRRRLGAHAASFGMRAGGRVVDGEWEPVQDPPEPTRDPRLGPPRR